MQYKYIVQLKYINNRNLKNSFYYYLKFYFFLFYINIKNIKF